MPVSSSLSAFSERGCDPAAVLAFVAVVAAPNDDDDENGAADDSRGERNAAGEAAPIVL
jgi:hypothetical protein